MPEKPDGTALDRTNPLVTGDLRQVWIYVTAPTLGALLAVPACRLSQPRDCCPGRACA